MVPSLPAGVLTPLSHLILAIELPFDPNIGEVGGLLLTWHGFFTAVGILAGVWLALQLARVVHFDPDDAYTLALIGVPSGIIGARLLFVAEKFDAYKDAPLEILRLTEGGISIWGAVIGGVAGPLAYALWKRWPVWRGLDIAALGLILGMGIGRIGDLINGEHLAKATDLPWGVVYTDPDSLAFAWSLQVGPHHPATTYEMLGDFAILGLLFWLILGPLRRYHGLTFFTYLLAYGVMRFFLSYLRLDSAETFVPGVTVPQLVSLIAVLGAIPPLLYVIRRGPQPDLVLPKEAAAPPPPGRARVRR